VTVAYALITSNKIVIRASVAEAKKRDWPLTGVTHRVTQRQTVGHV